MRRITGARRNKIYKKNLDDSWSKRAHKSRKIQQQENNMLTHKDNMLSDIKETILKDRAKKLKSLEKNESKNIKGAKKEV